jgi:hypothetical protein
MGFTYRYEANPGTLSELRRLLDLERQCCPFLTFNLVVESDRRLRLEITGPPETKGMIVDFFG